MGANASTATHGGGGTQSLERGFRLLRVIASRPQFGWRLSDLAVACAMDKGTVRRMLVCLIDERLVVQHAVDRRYFPGPMLFELGLALPEAGRFQRAAEEPLRAFARRNGGIALLLRRSGNEFVCSLRAGNLQPPGTMIEPGTRRPLFSSAGGVAILITMDRSEAARVLRDNIAQEIARQGTARLAGLRRMRLRSAEHGHGVSFGDVVPGVHAFGMAVRSGRQGGFAALTLIGTPQRHPPERLEAIRLDLETTSRQLSDVADQLGL